MSIYEDLLAEGDRDPGAVLVERPAPDRAVVTMNAPGKRNALTAGVCVHLNRALDELADDGELRTVILTGADGAFSAGGDLAMMRKGPAAISEEPEGSPDVWRWIRHQFGGVVRKIAATDKAFVAAINGPAAGVGLAFALTCDIAVASGSASLVPAFGAIGLVPEVGTSWALTRRLGYPGAFAFFAAGRHVPAEKALGMGLVQEVVEDADLAGAANRWADRIAELPPHALEMGKALLRGAADAGWEQSVRMEEFAEPNCFTTGAFSEAVGG